MKEVDPFPLVVVLVKNVEWGDVKGLRVKFFPVFNYVIFPFPPIVGVGCKRGLRQGRAAIDNGIIWTG